MATTRKTKSPMIQLKPPITKHSNGAVAATKQKSKGIGIAGIVVSIAGMLLGLMRGVNRALEIYQGY